MRLLLILYTETPYNFNREFNGFKFSIYYISSYIFFYFIFWTILFSYRFEKRSHYDARVAHDEVYEDQTFLFFYFFIYYTRVSNFLDTPCILKYEFTVYKQVRRRIIFKIDIFENLQPSLKLDADKLWKLQPGIPRYGYSILLYNGYMRI